MLVAIWPVVFIVVGALIWALVQQPIVKRMGEYSFAIGLLWLVYTLAGKTLSLGG
jgi:hypothetical protein